MTHSVFSLRKCGLKVHLKKYITRILLKQMDKLPFEKSN